MLYVIRANPHRVAAVGVWLLGLGATYSFILSYGLEPLYAVLITLLLQALLTYLQHLIWARGSGQFDILGYVALALDGFINFGGAYPIIARLPGTQSYQAVAELVGADAFLPSMLAFLLSATLSLLLCAAPEKLWYMSRSRSVI